MNFFPLLLLRLMFGLGLAWHGFQALFLHDGAMEGLAGMIGSHNWPAPTAMAYIAKLSELLCGLMVALGLFTRWAAFVCAFTMGTAVYMKSMGILAAPDGVLTFGEIELAALYLFAFAALVFTGPGCFSIDYLRRPQPENGELDDIGLPEELDGTELEDEVILDSLDRPAATTQRPSAAATANPATAGVPPVPPATPDAGSTAPGRGRSAE